MARESLSYGGDRYDERRATPPGEHACPSCHASTRWPIVSAADATYYRCKACGQVWFYEPATARPERG